MKFAVAVVLVLASCGNKSDQPSSGDKREAKPAEPAAPPAPPAGYVAHPNFPRLFIQVPADAKPVDNQFGAGWFANDDKSFAITYKLAEHDDIERMKSSIKEVVKTFVKEEKRPDGFVLIHDSSLDDSFGLQMVRKVGDTLIKCTTGTAKDVAGVEAVIKACESLRN